MLSLTAGYGVRGKLSNLEGPQFHVSPEFSLVAHNNYRMQARADGWLDARACYDGTAAIVACASSGLAAEAGLDYLIGRPSVGTVPFIGVSAGIARSVNTFGIVGGRVGIDFKRQARISLRIEGRLLHGMGNDAGEFAAVFLGLNYRLAMSAR